MQRLAPKAIWLFFVNYLPVWFFILLILSSILVPLITTLYTLVMLKNNISDDVINGDNVARGIIAGSVGYSILFIVVWISISYLWAYLSWRAYRYEVAENGFKKESGVIWKRYVTIPYERIQNVDILRGVWARILGLSNLQIQTAGMGAVVSRFGSSGMGAEASLPGLTQEDAETLRDRLINLARGTNKAGL